MFTSKELSSIDYDYFNVIASSGYCITLQSKNTKHYWHIISTEANNHPYCRVLHNHHNNFEYHEHKHERNLSAAISMIQNHDAFQLDVRNKRKYPKVAH